jgi:hypothetical protein
MAMCSKCHGLDETRIRKGIEDGSIPVGTTEDLIEDGPKIGSLMVHRMVLEFLHQTGSATEENIKYLGDISQRIASSSRDEQDGMKEELIGFINQVAEKLMLEEDG